jgi:transcriptional regulator GlxA family with amidase domain
MNSDDNASIHHNYVRGGLASWQLKRVNDYIEANLGSTIRAADLARVAQQSVSYFSRAFRRSVGYTPHAYVMRQRMRRAQDIMLSSEHPLSRVALECGMSDQAHFSRVFRKLVGTNPWAWRRQFSSGPRMEPTASGNHAAPFQPDFHR